MPRPVAPRSIAIRASRIEDIAAAIAIDLPVLPPSGARERPLEPEPEVVKKPEPAPAPPPPPEPEVRPTRIITSPVRGGQQIYAQGGDLIVTASVSPGAELLADGNIHVYGAMRGRALAGIKGNTKARIFCQQMTAEMVSIAGQYKVCEDLRRDHSLDELAGRVAMSRRSFTRRFQKATGMTVGAWLDAERLRRAKDLRKELVAHVRKEIGAIASRALA